MSTDGAAISKREQKRRAKQSKTQEIKEESPIATPTVETPAAITTEPIYDESEPLKSFNYLEPVQKRIRNYLKKKQKIDQLLEKANDPEEYKKLNKDQLDQIARKEQVLAPLKELQNLAEQFTTMQVEEAENEKRKEYFENKKKQEDLSAFREEVYAEGLANLTVVVDFLKKASLLRAEPDDDSNVNEAHEKLLALIYHGGEESIEAAAHLKNADDAIVPGSTVTYKHIHQGLYTEKKDKPIEVEDQISDENDTRKDAELNGSNFISLSELSQKPSTLNAGGISFLNESEIEGTSMPESVGVATTTQAEAAPEQTIAEHDGNKASEDLTWAAMRTPRIKDWADEDTEPEVAASTEKETIAVSAEDAPTKAGLQPLSDFQTIEKKSQNRDNRGRGRGANRGRGDRTGGRGRGAGKPRAQDAQ